MGPPPLTAMVLAVLFAACAPVLAAAAEGIIAGSREPCQNEGEEVAVDSIKDMSCFQCICKNGFVECQQEQCPDVKNCYMQMPREGCCVRCKGCLYKGVIHSSNTEWSEPGDSCRVLRCEAGVVTESTTHCYTPCENTRPPLPGHCCPSCHGCYINGQKVSEGRDATLWEDPCLKCHCSKGKLTCAKRACPVLPCPPALQRTPPGQCCPVCGEGKPAKLLFPDHTPNKPCILGKDYHSHGKSFVLDRCTHCSCQNGTTVCSRNSCPVLECAPQHQKTTPGECCPHCPPVEEVRTTCTTGGKTYEDGVAWRLDECTSCMCHLGDPTCAMEQCPALTCPSGYRKERSPGQCCHRCVESDGVCTVFGDPHYKTFDGKFYSFQGSCKYQLAADCVNHTFSIRATNDGRNTKYSSWTKTISLKIGDIKINLGRKLRVKVNGTKVDLPYDVPGNVAHIERKDDSIYVNTEIGVKLTWDGTGFLEVAAPTAYKDKLCGLCGNYNSIVRDDLKMRNGVILKEVNREDMWKLGNSWRIGGKKACSRKQENMFKEKPCNRRVKKVATRMCRFFNKSESFSACRHKLNPHNYYESCVMDMCECPTQTCYCEAFSAYARECKRLGATPGEWRRATRCGLGGQPRGLQERPPARRQRHRTSSRAPMPQFISPLESIPRPPPGRARPPPPILH